ncbi:biosynthetic-type acetolactate synthase large subunit [Syntrophus aciditrophicus]|uniref:Acetolactate synthase n=1 Tax=Syntrophus aciditrophicus (strain SB) TaxID=56780 RepID=Q2LXP1_SYNAS|nr:biosynthetic-type acetolactate synthase large subunit [Syntrophus aciditrophicus]ABC78849.1 acetolactate synthase large subunit [Syntrophus aciditrophicus SB]
METIGADIVLQILQEEGVEAIFGYPGGNSLPLHDRLLGSPIRHYLTRHEQAAAHAADGYARATGRVGVCLSTSGPGATNLVTGIATAHMDSSPIVALTCQVNTSLMGRDAFQETDIIGITLPITKHSYLVHDVNNLATILRQSFKLARSGRPGPVLVDMPRDILAARCERAAPRQEAPEATVEQSPSDRQQLEKIARALNQSERPVIIMGGGVKLSNSCDLMLGLIEKGGIPFTTTMMGVGSITSGNGYDLGFIGTHGNQLANSIVHQSDFILAVGMRFSDRSTSLIDEFAPLATIAQTDIDPTSIGKNVKVAFPFVGEIRETISALVKLVERKERTPWMERIQQERETTDNCLPYKGCGKAGHFISLVQDAMPRETIAISDVGLNQIWTMRTWKARTPRSLITSGGMGTMGFSVPAAMGAKIGAPDRSVVAICGDGGFYMNIQELATISYYNIPVKIIVLNNGHLGMVRQLQDLFYESRFSTVDLGTHVDLVTVAKGFGIPARRISVDDSPEAALAAMAGAEGPYMLEVMVDPNDYVFPIIPPGHPNISMIHGKIC